MHRDRTVALTHSLNSLTSLSIRHVDAHQLFRLLSDYCGGAQQEPLVFKGHTWIWVLFAEHFTVKVTGKGMEGEHVSRVAVLWMQELCWEHVSSDVHM